MKKKTLCLVFLIGQIIGAAQPTAGLVAHYKLDGNATDASGNNNNGTNNGAFAAEDRFGNCGKAMEFNGTSNYIFISN